MFKKKSNFTIQHTSITLTKLFHSSLNFSITATENMTLDICLSVLELKYHRLKNLKIKQTLGSNF